MSPTALLTRSQMDPFVAALDTLVALVPPRLFDGSNRTQMLTLVGNHTGLNDLSKANCESQRAEASASRIVVAS